MLFKLHDDLFRFVGSNSQHVQEWDKNFKHWDGCLCVYLMCKWFLVKEFKGVHCHVIFLCSFVCLYQL